MGFKATKMSIQRTSNKHLISIRFTSLSLVKITCIWIVTVFAILFAPNVANGLVVNQPVLSIMIIPKVLGNYLPVPVSNLNSPITTGNLFPITNFPQLPSRLTYIPQNVDAYIRTYTPQGQSLNSLESTPNKFNLFVVEAIYTQDQSSLNNLVQQFLSSVTALSSPVSLNSQFSIADICLSCGRTITYPYKIGTLVGNLTDQIAAFSVNGVDYFVVSESSTDSIDAISFNSVVLSQRNYALNSDQPKVSVTEAVPSNPNRTVEVGILIIVLGIGFGYLWYKAAAKKAAEAAKQAVKRF